MSAEIEQANPATSARKSPATGKSKKPVISSSVTWEGRKVPLHCDRTGLWRIRCRSRTLFIDSSLETTVLAIAKENAKAKLAAGGAARKRIAGTLADVIRVYKTISKKCSQKSAENFCRCLTRAVRGAWGKEPEQIKVERIPDLWPDYAAFRQGLKQPDYNKRRSINRGINSVMTQARCLFIKILHGEYRRHGIILPENAADVRLLPEMQLVPAEANDAELIAEWEQLREKNLSLWVAVGLARFAGLRKNEIEACRGSWVVKRKGAVAIELRDREDENYLTKTGRIYYPYVLHAGLAEYLLTLAPDARAVGNVNQEWMTRFVPQWVRPFTGSAQKPLHRLRGLYADQIKAEREEAFLAHRAGVKAASEALGHTTTATTENHYLSKA